MKKRMIILLAFFPVLLWSCLKDKNVTDREYGIEGTEDLKLVELTNAPSDLLNLEFSTLDTTIHVVTVHANTAKPVENDVTVTLQVDTSLITAYNTANGTSYEMPPASIYTMGNLAVTIPKGSRDGHLQLTTKASDIAAGEYAIGFRIVSVSDPSYVISQNYKTIVTRLSVKNKFDGVYILRSKQIDWSAYNIINTPWEWPASFGIDLITSSANSVNLYSGAHGSYIHPAVSTTGYSGFGQTNPRFVFDMNTNALINVVNDAPVGSFNRTFAMNPAVTDSRYDPATKTIYAAFLLKQPGRPDLQIYDTLIYQGPR